MQQQPIKRRRSSSSDRMSSPALLRSSLKLAKNKSVLIGWLTESATPCVEISSSGKSARLDLEQWSGLKNYATSVTDYFKTSVIPPYVDSSVQFVKYFGKPHVKVGSKNTRVALNAEDWNTLVNSFKPIDSALDIATQSSHLVVDHLNNISHALKVLGIEKVCITFGDEQFSALRVRFPVA
jgi:hypothetical protein